MKHTFCLILTAVVLITAVLSGCGANRELEEEMARLKAELEALQEGLATAEVTLEDTGEEFASEEIQEHGEETEPESDTEKEIRQILTEIDLALSVDNYASAEEGIEKVTEIAESAGINLENITFDNGTAQKFIEISETEIEILKSYEIAREEAERTSMLAQAEETGNYRRFIPTTDPAKAPMQEGGMILLGESLRLGQYLVWNGNDLCPEFLKTADLGKLKELLSDYQKAIDKARMLLEDAGFLPVDILTSRYRDDLLIYGTVIVHQYIKDNFLAQVLEEEKRREEMGE